MLLGPLFRVEMVTVARRRRYFVLRVVYGALALFILWATYSSLRSFAANGSTTVSIQQGAQLATNFFLAFSWLQIGTVFVVGPAVAVGTISTERERRTIEYLFTTDLSNAEIVLGKLTARLCLLAQLLLVGLPVLFLFRLLGGIPAQLLVTTFLYSATAGVLIAALSICVSVWSEQARDATVRVYLLLGVLFFLPSLAQSAFGAGPFRTAVWDAWGQPVVEFCLSINPLATLGTAIGNQNAIGAGLDAALIWETLSKQVLVALGAICVAICAVRRVHLRETTRGTQRAPWKRSWKLPRWQRPLRSDAIFWKELFAGSAITRLGAIGRISVALILLTVCGFSVGALVQHFQFNQYSTFHSYLSGLTGAFVTGVLLLLAARAAGLVTSEKERDCWLSLLATPLSGREIIRGKMWGNLYSVRWPLVVLLVNWGIGILLAPTFLWAALALLATFFLLAFYVTNLGLFFSLRSQTTLRAMGSALGTLLFTGGGYLFCCCMVLSSRGGSDEDLMIFFTGCIPFLSMFPALAFLELVEDFGGDFWVGMHVAYGLGMFAYLAIGMGLYHYMTVHFDQLAGRTVAAPD